jgi:hypothetical protein
MTISAKSPVRPLWDKPIMLLSSDWAYDYLAYIGLEVLEQYQEGVRNAARIAVLDMIGQNESYYSVDFDEQRIKGTYQLFLGKMKRQVSVAMINHISRVLDSIVTASDDERATVNLIEDAIFALNSNSIDYPSKPTVSTVTLFSSRTAWEQSHEWYERLQEADLACWTSSTDWDVYLRSLTDLPSALADYLYEVGCRMGRLPLYWSLLKRAIEQVELDKLKIWLFEAARYKVPTDRNLVFPAYIELVL